MFNSYLDKVRFLDPLLGRRQQNCPYEAFGGDGMLTRLLLKLQTNSMFRQQIVKILPLLP